MARNLNQVVGAEDAGYVAPLLANDRFRRGAAEQLALADDAAAKAATAASLHEDYSSTIRLFASVKRGLAAIVKRFPEAAPFTDEAAKQVDMAMQAVVGDVPAPAPAPTPGQQVQSSLRTGAPSGPAPSPFLKP